MRSQLITLLLTFTLAISVNAAAINKREALSPVQTCINSIKAVGAKLQEIKPDIDAFNSAAGYSGALAIHQKEQLIEGLLDQANKDCLSVTQVTTIDVTGIVPLVSKIVPEVVELVAVIVSKKLEFENLAMAITLVKKDIKAISVLVNKLTDGLLGKASFTDKIVGVSLKTQLDTAFASVAAL